MCTIETPETPTSTRAETKVSGGSIHILPRIPLSFRLFRPSPIK
jgi:hypothetical protein